MTMVPEGREPPVRTEASMAERPSRGFKEPGSTLPGSDLALGPSGLPSDAPAGQGEPLLRLCEWDQCRPLAGRQTRFASEACKTAWYELHRPRIASPVAGKPRAGTIKALILGVLQDGEWHSAYDLSLKVRAGEHSIKARLSELRRGGHDIREDLPNGSSRRPHRYRLVP